MPTDGRISRISFMRKLLAESLTNPNGALLSTFLLHSSILENSLVNALHATTALKFLQEQNASDLLPHWKMLISALLPNILDAR